MAYYNIAQLTNFDVISAPTTQIVIRKGDEQGITETVDYKIISSSMLRSPLVNKFGYCVNDNEGINYPIFIKTDSDGNAKKIYIGKDGMYEFQSDNWFDSNAEDTDTRTIEINLTEVWVPAVVPFVIDYAYKVGE